MNGKVECAHVFLQFWFSADLWASHVTVRREPWPDALSCMYQPHMDADSARAEIIKTGLSPSNFPSSTDIVL